MDWHSFGSYVLSGLVLWGVKQAATIRKENHSWRVSVDSRLLAIERKLRIVRD
jgi:hypothetical protein